MTELDSTKIYGDLEVTCEIKNKASLSSEGVVRLSSSISSTSESEAATPLSVKSVNDFLQSHLSSSSMHITSAERSKLAGIEANANNYTHPSSHAASMITESTTRRFVTDTEKATWNSKVDSETGKGLSSNDYTSAEKSKLAGIAANANNYTHPSTHAASMITESTTRRFVTDTEKATWNGKVDSETGKGLSTNDYTSAERSKLAGIEANANNYTHPSTHAASMITESTTRRFVTDAEKATWNSKVNSETGKGLSTNDYTTAEKNKLAGIAANANNYSHPSSHAASMITESTTRRFVTDTEKAAWNGKADSSHNHDSRYSRPENITQISSAQPTAVVGVWYKIV